MGCALVALGSMHRSHRTPHDGLIREATECCLVEFDGGDAPSAIVMTLDPR